MNIVSYNIRGLGRGVKWAAIRRMIRKNKPPINIEGLRPNILVVVEAKKQAINAARYKEEVNNVRS